MREFFFPTGCFYVDAGQHFVRVRRFARTTDKIELHAKGEVSAGKYQQNANLTMVVVDSVAQFGDLPELAEFDVAYTPWIDVLFVGATSFELIERDGKKGLLVKIGGSIQLHDPDQSMPFSLNELLASEEIRFDDDVDGPPHWPISGV